MRNSNVNMIKAGERLRQLRGIRTRTGVAKVLSVPYSTLQSWEDGNREPNGRAKQMLADYYGVTVEDIFFAE